MRKVLNLLFIFSLVGCIDTINIKTSSEKGSVLIDGWITDEAGPYTVKVAKSIPFDNSQPLKVYTIPISQARVIILDSLGETQQLTETVPGTYVTSTLLGKLGHSYRVTVETSDGKKYKSEFEKIVPVPAIQKIESQFLIVESLFINTNGSSRLKKLESFAISVITTDPADEQNFYRWQVDGIFEFFSSYTDPREPDPIPPRNQCWAPKFRIEPQIRIGSDEYLDGQNFKTLLANVIYDRPTKFLVKVRQQSLTKKGHFFLSSISKQQTTTGTLFDPPPSSIKGNLINENDPIENVIGYFGASSVSRSQLLIERFKDASFIAPSQNIPIKSGDCRFLEPGATNFKPDGF
ncbi:MAG: DUF4249 domain-containing protein [Cyclobacteriaceae bacterium]|nr:DUF4249 domain-containing protein [Cyclobacteriaceae bacterium]